MRGTMVDKAGLHQRPQCRGLVSLSNGVALHLFSLAVWIGQVKIYFSTSQFLHAQIQLQTTIHRFHKTANRRRSLRRFCRLRNHRARSHYGDTATLRTGSSGLRGEAPSVPIMTPNSILEAQKAAIDMHRPQRVTDHGMASYTNHFIDIYRRLPWLRL